MTTPAFSAPIGRDRILAVIERNFTATRFGPSYWILVLAGLFDPLFYLIAVGAALGAMMDKPIVYDGHAVSFTAFVAPAMLATSAISSVMGVSIAGFYAKLQYARTFEVMLFTPVRTFEIVVGELFWAVVRSTLFSTLFLCVLVAMRQVTPGEAFVALPAAVLTGAAFSAAGMAVTTYVRGWQDFDLIAIAQTAMMLFSGTFFPVTAYPQVIETIVQLTPLYHAIELLRMSTLGQVSPAHAVHVGYLLLMLAGCLALTHRRIDKRLRG
ncbi:ABC transporter permease [Nonomuraea insulae]|uniref:Transport permease protein n=1 Tax=Nonomuraea insulae TaxID=1616787 RepID=A0ABW1D8G2_9ACTN